MISSIAGIITAKKPPLLVIEANNIGYEIFATMNTFYSLPEIGSKTKIYTHFAVREDAQTLYGFCSETERQLFRSLIKVNGVGPKLALTILSGVDAATLADCIQNGEVARLVKLPGVGKKTAERLIIEMRDKLDIEVSETLLPGTIASSNSIERDAIDALLALGYSSKEANQSIAKHKNQADITAEQLIKLALQGLALAS